MKKSYNVWWSDTAKNDLVSIIEFIDRENPRSEERRGGEEC